MKRSAAASNVEVNGVICGSSKSGFGFGLVAGVGLLLTTAMGELFSSFSSSFSEADDLSSTIGFSAAALRWTLGFFAGVFLTMVGADAKSSSSDESSMTILRPMVGDIRRDAGDDAVEGCALTAFCRRVEHFEFDATDHTRTKSLVLRTHIRERRGGKLEPPQKGEHRALDRAVQMALRWSCLSEGISTSHDGSTVFHNSHGPDAAAAAAHGPRPPPRCDSKGRPQPRPCIWA